MLLNALMLTSLTGPALAADPAALAAGLADGAGWTEIGTDNADGVGVIKVRHKSIGGVDCLEGVGTTDVPVPVLLEATVDIPGNLHWSSAAIKESEFLSTGAAGFDYYQYLANPFPIKDRFWFNRATIVGDPTTGPVKFLWHHIDPNTYPERYAKVQKDHGDAVVTDVNVGAWVFSPVDGGTEVRFQTCTDAGGSIPAWAGELAAKTTLPTNIADLVREGKRRSQ